MKSSMTLFGLLSGALLWECCLELRIGYFMGLLWLVRIGLQEPASGSMSPPYLALVCAVDSM